MSTINVSIVDQNLTITNAPTIAAGDINVDVVEFEFDESWDGFGCVAAFWRDGDPAVYRSAIYPATGRAVVPHEVMTEEGRICFGVVGQKDNMTKTSCVGYYDIKAGALTTGTDTDPPTPDIYEQMLDAVGDVRQAFADALVEAEAAAGRVEIYDGLASDLPTYSATQGTLRRVELPSDMKLSDFDRVTIMLTNVGRSDLASGATGTLSVYTDNSIALGDITVGSSGGTAFIEMAGLSGSPNSNVLRWVSTSRYLNSGSPSTESVLEMHSWGTNGVLAAAEHLDMLLTSDTYVRIIGYCNEVAAQDAGSVSVTPAAVASAIGDMNVTQKAALKTALGYLTQHQSLTGYVTDTALATALASYVTSSGLSTALADYVTSSGLSTALADYVTSSGLSTTLASYVTSSAMATALADYVSKAAQGTWTVNHTQPVVRKGDGSLWVLPPGEGSGDTVIENTVLITMTTYNGDDYASLEAGEIFDILDAGAKNIILIDRAGRQCNLIAPPEEETNDFTVAKFWTFDESNAEIIVYSVGDGGLVSSTTVSIPDGLPASSVSDAGKVLKVGSNGSPEWASGGTYTGPTITTPTSIDEDKILTGHADGSTSWEGQERLQLSPVNGIITVPGSYADLIAKLSRPNPARILCVTPDTTQSNLEGIELRTQWFNDTTNAIMLVGIHGAREYFITLTQTGSGNNRTMQGVLGWRNLGDANAPTAPTPNASNSEFKITNTTEYTIAAADNRVYKVPSGNTKVTISSAPSSGTFNVIFTTPSTLPDGYFFMVSTVSMPDGWTGVEANKRYDIYVEDRYAYIDARSVS